MPTITYEDNWFEDEDIIVSVPEGVRLTDYQRQTVSLVGEMLDDEVCHALIGDQTCVGLISDEGRYGFDYLASCVDDKIEEYTCCPPHFYTWYIEDGFYLLCVFGSLFLVIGPDDYPEMPSEFEGSEIPVESLLEQRERALEACANYRRPLAMVVKRNPVYHEEYDEEKATWAASLPPFGSRDGETVGGACVDGRGEDWVMQILSDEDAVVRLSDES